MPVIIAYAPDALVYNAGLNTWTLRPDYNQVQHRVEIDFIDDDTLLDGDTPGDEVGSDSTQDGVVTDMLGNPVISGQIYNEEFYGIDVSGTEHYIDVIEIGGVVVGFMSTTALTPGTSYSITRVQDVDSGTTFSYSAYYNVPCFASGTKIMAARGPVRVEHLKRGDRVVTRDRGLQPLLWRNSRHVSPEHLAQRPQHGPVAIGEALGQPRIARPLIVSPQHRILLTAAKATLFFGASEVLAAAGHMPHTARPGSAMRRGIDYHHLLFEQHELVLANGLWAESLFSSGQAAWALFRCPHDVPIHATTARRCLKRWEAELLLAHSPARISALAA